MIKLCAEPTCHTRISQGDVVCSLHKLLCELDEVHGEILEREQYVADLKAIDVDCVCNQLPFLCNC